ncbi:MAG: NlpC/P60 family protein [Veillonellales bacterium]
MQRRCLVICLFISLLCFSTAYAASITENTVLRQGMHGDEVYMVQNKLHELGYFKGNPDGTFGVTTRTAVVKFQRASGLEPDGIAGYHTLQALHVIQSNTALSRNFSGKRSSGEFVVSTAKQYLGVPYVWGGNSPKGFDCSGFVMYVFNQAGFNLPRMADAQFKVGLPIQQKALRGGDLVFFSTYEPGPSHVGIYTGNGEFIHASSGAGHVIITSLYQPYFIKRYLGARRLTGEI